MVHQPCVAEWDGCVEYPVARAQGLAEVCQMVLKARHTKLIQAAVGHGMRQHQDAEVGRVRALNLRAQR